MSFERAYYTVALVSVVCALGGTAALLLRWESVSRSITIWGLTVAGWGVIGFQLVRLVLYAE